MNTLGFNKPLYILPFDHRSSFQNRLFDWTGELTPEQTERIVDSKQVTYEGFGSAVAGSVPREKAGILVDEQFGAAILGAATRRDGRDDVGCIVLGHGEDVGKVRGRLQGLHRLRSWPYEPLGFSSEL
jgi:5-dehydro-2-deoxygluconokinase